MTSLKTATFKSDLNHFLSLQDDDWSKDSKFGTELGFHGLLPEVDELRELAKELVALDLDHAPVRVLSTWSDHVKRVFEIFTEIQNISTSDLDRKRGSILRDFSGVCAKFQEATIPWLAYLRQKDDQAEQKKRELIAKLEAAKERAIGIVTHIESSAAKKGAISHLNVFRVEADRHSWGGSLWLAITFLSAILVGYIGWQFLSDMKPPPKWAVESVTYKVYLFQLTFAKLLILSAASVVLIIASRTYKAHRHSEAVYRQKAASLETFQLFLDAAGEESAARNTVLLQATQSLFCQRSTGYVDKESAGEVGPLLELTQVATKDR